MKNKNFGKPLCRLITMVAICMLSLNAMAYDFSYTYQGKTLRYDITSSNTVAVTYYSYSYNNNYVSADVVIPSSVTNNGTTYSVTSIGGNAFSGCSSLTSVNIPNSVTSIGNSAFSGCSSLTSVNIPNSVTSIGNYAFVGCSSLTSVTIPNSVTSIGNSAFSGCSSLTSVNIPNSVTSIGNSAFSGCSSLTSVNIPNSVTSIGNYAFVGCSSLTSVTIPNSVTTIGSSAFYNCSSLTSVIIGNSVTEIGSSAFYNCSSLTSVIIGNSVTSIGEDAFSGCSSLTSVTIPNSVTFIGSYAFRNCTGLTSVTLPNNATIRSSAFYGTGKITIDSITYCGNNSDTLTIGNYTFIGTGLLTFYLNGNAYLSNPNNVQIYDCDESKSGDLIIPSTISYNGTTYSVTSIGSSAFKNCSSLTSVTIPNSVTSIGGSAFAFCSGLTSVTIPNSVTSIGNNAFGDCNNLTSITIPESVTSIGNYAFYGCSNLTSITIPNSVTSIGNNAFRVCSRLTTLNFNAINCSDFSSDSDDLPFRNCPISTINIGDGVQRIPAYFAYNLDSLTSVTIPNSVTSIGNNAFRDCNNLTSVTIGNSVTSISSSAFSGCSSLTTLNFNAINCSDFDSYDNHPFASSPITTINIGDSVQRIPANFANGKSGLISISIPNSITEIGYSAFMNCSGLIAANIGNGVSSIGNPFRGCTNLTYLTIGSGVETIEDLAFIDCNMLSHITSKATTPPEIASSNVFPYPNECSLTVPCGSLGAYTDQMNRWYLLFNPRIDEDIVFAFSVSANDDAFGIVSNEALSCSVRKITAIPFDGYEFVSWNDGNTSNPRTINITNDTSFVAVFATIGSSALQEVESTREFVLYPNPARGFVTIEFEALQESSSLMVADLGGRVVKTFDIAAGTESIRFDLRDLPSGVYTLMIGNTTKKLIVE
ncbi:MAG: leucine-rich repeat protein [Candidatus Onthomorpha sp.]